MRALKVILFAVLCGGLIFVFSITEGVFRYVFSLGALYLGYQFFVRNDSKAMRIWFFIAGVCFYFILTFFYAIFLFLQEQAPAA